MTTASRENELDLFYFKHIPRNIRRGRNVAEGYARAWGLAHSDLAEKVRAHPLYREAWAIGEGRSLIEEPRRLNLFLLLINFLSKIDRGHIVEFGSYRGGNVLFMAKVAQTVLPGTQVFAFDSFVGMPNTDHSVDAHVAGDFRDVDMADLQRHAIGAGLDNLHFIKGMFNDSLPSALARTTPVALCHIDCDLMEPTKFVYETIKPVMVHGGYYVFDDALTATCLGEMEAIEDLVVSRDGLRAEQTWPHLIYRAMPQAA